MVLLRRGADPHSIFHRLPVSQSVRLLTTFRMSVRTIAGIALITAGFACAGLDRTITRGADGEPEWSRRLAAAVPLGISADSARSVMLRNGFQCQEGADSVAYIWCDKLADKAVVKRRWQAVINLDSQRHVYEVRGSTGLIGP